MPSVAPRNHWIYLSIFRVIFLRQLLAMSNTHPYHIALPSILVDSNMHSCHVDQHIHHLHRACLHIHLPLSKETKKNYLMICWWMFSITQLVEISRYIIWSSRLTILIICYVFALSETHHGALQLTNVYSLYDFKLAVTLKCILLDNLSKHAHIYTYNSTEHIHACKRNVAILHTQQPQDCIEIAANMKSCRL